jgi:hypothetical protein
MELDELHEGVSQSPSTDRNLEGMRGLIRDPETAAQQRRATALRVGSLAAAGHHAASDLEEHFPQAARYIQDAAAGFDHISNFLRDPNLDEVATFVGNLGRKQPAAVIAAVFMVAVGVSWFLTSSSDMSSRTMDDDRGRGTYGVR